MKHVAVIAFALCALFLSACTQNDPNTAQGYVEADYIFVAPQVAGRIEQLYVDNGTKVEKGAQLLALDTVQAQAQLDDAKATLQNAEKEYQRFVNLPRGKVVSESSVDLATRNFENAKAAVTMAQWSLDQRMVVSPVEGIVDEVLFRPGEVVNAGQATIRLLAPESRKIRFYVNESVLPRLTLGTEISATCDGCGSAIGAKVSFISPQAEYTPPVIYSVETRGKLVFMIEAIPQLSQAHLNVGMPLTVHLPATTQTVTP